MRKYLFCFFAAVFFVSCEQSLPAGFDLPEECGSKCYFARDMNSLHDAILNSSAAFSKCICFESGEISGDIIVAKPLFIIGKNDGSSRFRGLRTGLVITSDNTMLKNIAISGGNKGITVHNSKNVKLRNITVSGISVKESALKISGSSVSIKGLELENIRAGSLLGGRGVIVTGEKSEVIVEGSTIKGTAGTGLLVNNSHVITVSDSQFSKCGFAAIWVQNSSNVPGMLTVENSNLSDSGSVALQILGESDIHLSKTVITGVGKREINFEMISDGIVIKNRRMSGPENSVVMEGVEISGYERAGIILDGIDNKMLSGVSLDDVKVASEKGFFGLVVQNGTESEDLRNGISKNPFTQQDIELQEPLFIVETFQE